jgi:membrane protein DedA with SNARE-associated domain
MNFYSMEIVLDIINFISTMDYLAILLLTFISAVLIVVPVPYFPILITAALVTQLDPHLIALYGAIGAVAAKSLIYLISYYGTDLTRAKGNFNFNEYPITFRIIKRYGWLVIFIASITPIPDNIVFIPIGMYKYSPIRFVAVTFIAKMILNEIVVWTTLYLGKPIVSNLIENLDFLTLITTISISLILFGVFLFFFLKIKWPLYLEKFFERLKALNKK